MKSSLDADPDFVAALEKAAAQMRRDHWPASSPRKIKRTLWAWLEQWIEEVLCDHLAVEASGPAFLWSFAAFVLPQNYSEPSPSHPPSTLRINLALGQLAQNGWRPFLESSAPGVTGWLDEVAAGVGDPMPQPYEFLQEQILRRSDLWRDAAAVRVGAERLSPEKLTKQAREAADLLSRLILPVGHDRTPLDPRAILLGGWLDGFARHQDSYLGVVHAPADRRLQNLVGKAIEMSTVLDSWNEP
jgi:hypothetical protein